MKAIIEITPIGYGLKETIENTVAEVKPEGISFNFIRGRDERTHRPLRYKVSMTPAVRTGSWTTDDDRGQIENVVQKNGDKGVITVEGIWVEGGERRTFKVIIAEELPPVAKHDVRP